MTARAALAPSFFLHLDKAPVGHRDRDPRADHHVVQQAHIQQIQGIAHRDGQFAVLGAGRGIARTEIRAT